VDAEVEEVSICIICESGSGRGSVFNIEVNKFIVEVIEFIIEFVPFLHKGRVGCCSGIIINEREVGNSSTSESSIW